MPGSTWDFFIRFAHMSRPMFLAIPLEYFGHLVEDNGAEFPVDSKPNETLEKVVR